MPSAFLIQALGYRNNNYTPYQQHLLCAVMETAGAAVLPITLMATTDLTRNPHSPLYFRDFAFLLETDKKKAIVTSALGKTVEGVAVGERLTKAAQAFDLTYQSENIPIYFEGGNVFYIAAHHLLLHGQVVSDYVRDNRRGCSYSYPTTGVTQDLEKHFSLFGVTTLGLDLSDAMMATQTNKDNHKKPVIYHLDCFMQTMPDGKVFILNAKMLSEKSYRLLKEKLGENLIDLEYEHYETEKVMLNFIAIPYQDEIRIISMVLPPCIEKKLESFGYKIITSNTLNPYSEKFIQPFAEKVRAAMVCKGHNVTIDTLLNPSNDPRINVNNMMSYNNCDFFDPGGQAGPHCLTLEIPHAIQHSVDEQALVCSKEEIRETKVVKTISPVALFELSLTTWTHQYPHEQQQILLDLKTILAKNVSPKEQKELLALCINHSLFFESTFFNLALLFNASFLPEFINQLDAHPLSKSVDALWKCAHDDETFEDRLNQLQQHSSVLFSALITHGILILFIALQEKLFKFYPEGKDQVVDLLLPQLKASDTTGIQLFVEYCHENFIPLLKEKHIVPLFQIFTSKQVFSGYTPPGFIEFITLLIVPCQKIAWEYIAQDWSILFFSSCNLSESIPEAYHTSFWDYISQDWEKFMPLYIMATGKVEPCIPEAYQASYQAYSTKSQPLVTVTSFWSKEKKEGKETESQNTASICSIS